jgi:hypothetical protein
MGDERASIRARGADGRNCASDGIVRSLRE